MNIGIPASRRAPQPGSVCPSKRIARSRSSVTRSTPRSCTLADAGLASDLWRRVLRAYAIAMPSAFVCVLAVRPVVLRLVALTVKG